MSRSTRQTNSSARRSSGAPAGSGGRVPYSPAKRTGLLLSGTGVHGIYHAGVLRALSEAGIKIDVIAGHGIGAVSAMLGAIDDGTKLWDARGIWAPARVRQYYRWHWPLRGAAVLLVVLGLVFLVPLVVAAASAAAYAVGFLLTLAGVTAGTTLITWASAEAAAAFAGPALPTVVPRLAMLIVLLIAAVSSAGVVLSGTPRPGLTRTRETRWWWRLLASPLDLGPLRHAVMRSAWDLVRGAATDARPAEVTLSRRYVDVLSENLGQPGCRELMLGVSDLDARRDVVAALLVPAVRDAFFAPQPGRERGADVVDLSSAKDMVIDLLGAAVTPSIAAEAQPVTFPTDSYWAGETHRACDRPGMLGRLLVELDAAQVTQVIVVSAAAPPQTPHRLRPARLEPRTRLGEACSAAEAAAFEDAVAAHRQRFDAMFTICPGHNPIGPFDVDGTYDEASDRRHRLEELLDGGYHDAYQQFIDPVVGASGEQLAPAMT